MREAKSEGLTLEFVGFVAAQPRVCPGGEAINYHARKLDVGVASSKAQLSCCGNLVFNYLKDRDKAWKRAGKSKEHGLHAEVTVMLALSLPFLNHLCKV